MLDRFEENRYIIEGVLENKWFRLARNECLKSIHNTRFGTVLILKNGKVFTGFNKDKSHPMIKKHYEFFAQSIHAELDVLLRVNPYRHADDIYGSKMFIYREDKMVGLSQHILANLVIALCKIMVLRNVITLPSQAIV